MLLATGCQSGGTSTADKPDVSATQQRLAPGDRDLQELHTMLSPGPVEPPCRAEYADGPLCDRDAAMFDVLDRFGPEGSATANPLYLLCASSRSPVRCKLHAHGQGATDEMRLGMLQVTRP